MLPGPRRRLAGCLAVVATRRSDSRRRLAPPRRRQRAVLRGDLHLPLGHYVLADVYGRQGQPAKAQEEVEKAKRLEAVLRSHPRPAV